MTVSRRTALTMLGLGAAGAASAEDLAAPIASNSQPSGYHFGPNRTRIVAALRNLADDIESGGSHVCNLIVTSKVPLEDFVTHTLAVEFSMKADA